MYAVLSELHAKKSHRFSCKFLQYCTGACRTVISSLFLLQVVEVLRSCFVADFSCMFSCCFSCMVVRLRSDFVAVSPAWLAWFSPAWWCDFVVISSPILLHGLVISPVWSRNFSIMVSWFPYLKTTRWLNFKDLLFVISTIYGYGDIQARYGCNSYTLITLLVYVECSIMSDLFQKKKKSYEFVYIFIYQGRKGWNGFYSITAFR